MSKNSDWFYNHTSGEILQKIKITLGFTEPDKKYWHGPFASEEAATQFYIDNRTAHPEWKEPTTNFWKARSNEVQGDVAKATNDILFGGVNAQNWFIRVGEILLGIVLIGVGVAKLTGTTNAISKIVKARIP
jgi:hypothetical protein